MSTIRPNQRKALEALAAGQTNRDAALVAGVAESTIYKWRSEDAFKQALQQATDDKLNDATRSIIGVVSVAIDTLQDVATNIEAPPTARVAAARAILDNALKLRTQLELEQRLATLETAAGLIPPTATTNGAKSDV